jgi:hypothetical protein
VQILPYGENRKLVLTQDITKVENTEAMRRDFVANVSHELKTPLTVLTGFLETVRDLPVSEEDRKRYIDMMLVQSMRMQHIVEDLLALAKLESDASRRRSTQWTSVGSRTSYMTPRRCPRAPRHPRGDRYRRGAARLGRRAAVGARQSGVERGALYAGRRAHRHPYDVHGRAFGVLGQRYGAGIAPEHIPRLTERFYRVDRSRSRDTGGTGLGLAIVKHVLSRHHADLRVTSEVGRGSTFRIVFPVDRSGYEPDRHSRCRNWAMPRVTPPDINCTLLQRIQYKGPLPFGEAAAFYKVRRLGAEPRQQLCLAYALLLGARWLAHILAVRLHDPRRGVVAQMHLQPSLITRALSVRSSIGKATSTRRNRLRSIQSALDRYSTSSPPAWK